MTITQARQTIVNLVSKFKTDLTPDERIALAMGDMALKTIDEMDVMLSQLENNERSSQ